MRTLADARRDFMRRTAEPSMIKMLAEREVQNETIVPCYPESKIDDIDELAGPLPKRLTLAVITSDTRVQLQYHVRDMAGSVGTLSTGLVNAEPIRVDKAITVAEVNDILDDLIRRGINTTTDGNQRMAAEIAEGVDGRVGRRRK